MAKFHLGDSRAENTRTLSDEAVPPIRWETYPTAANHEADDPLFISETNKSDSFFTVLNFATLKNNDVFQDHGKIQCALDEIDGHPLFLDAVLKNDLAQQSSDRNGSNISQVRKLKEWPEYFENADRKGLAVKCSVSEGLGRKLIADQEIPDAVFMEPEGCNSECSVKSGEDMVEIRNDTKENVECEEQTGSVTTVEDAVQLIKTDVLSCPGTDLAALAMETGSAEDASSSAQHEDTAGSSVFAESLISNAGDNQNSKKDQTDSTLAEVSNFCKDNFCREIHKSASEDSITGREGFSCEGEVPRVTSESANIALNQMDEGTDTILSSLTCDSDLKTKQFSQMAVDELTPTSLTPMSSTNLRKSTHSRQKHSNQVVASRHGTRRHGDCKDCYKEEPMPKHTPPSSALVPRKQFDVPNCLADDGNLFITAVTMQQEKTSEDKNQKCMHLKAAKISAALVGDAKVHRRTSYRIATARRQTPAASDEPDTAKQAQNTSVTAECDSCLSSLPTSHQLASSRSELLTRSEHLEKASGFQVSSKTTEPCSSEEGMRKSRPNHRRSLNHIDRGCHPSLAKDLLLSPTDVSGTPQWNDSSAAGVVETSDVVTTPTKARGIRRLKELFLDKTSPRDGSSTDPQSQQPQHFIYDDQQLTSTGLNITDGQLNCKNTMMDGKRSTDRAWKSVYAVLRGHHLYLHPDKVNQNLLVYEHPISVRAALVDIAYDYVKRKNVFRLTSYNISEYLMETHDQETMLQWIRSIQDCGYSSSDKEFSASRELIRQKRLMSRQASRSGTHDSSHRKHSDSQSSPRLASKIPEPVGLTRARKTSRDLSRSPQRDHQTTDEEAPKSPQHKSGGVILRHPDNSEQKSKEKTWKSKMVKKFKRLSSQSPGVPGVDQTGAFGVELDKCIPSATNEFVPLIVDACITVVESKGLTNKGIYRVPGNSAAISQLQAELNKDPASINLESDKWQDVNAVISLLKFFFRELPDPLITKELYASMIEANHVEDSTKRLLKIKRLLHYLPTHNFETFHFLARHLNKVASAGDVNMMDARNLAIIFGPTLLQPKQDMLNMVKDMSDQCRIVESIIHHCDWFFSSWDEDVNVPAFREKDSAMIPITGMDQQLLEKAEHMALEEQISGNKRLWRPNVVRKTNAKERSTGSVGSVLEMKDDRNLHEETLLQGGPKGGKKARDKDDDKNTKTRAKSVPPRPVSTLQVHAGKPVERMTETAPAKRKNSSPVTISRRESAAPVGRGSTRRQFHRSNSEASEKSHHLSSNSRTRQYAATLNTKAVSSDQKVSRHNKSLSSYAVLNSKSVHGQKPMLGSTPHGSEERLGSPHSSRSSSRLSSSRGTFTTSDLGDIKHRKISSHNHKRTDAYYRTSHSKSTTGSRKKLETTSQNVEQREERSAKTGEQNVKSNECETQKIEHYRHQEPELERQVGAGGKGELIGARKTEETSLVLRKADSRKVWNAATKTWEDLPKGGSASTPAMQSPTKSVLENSQPLSSDVSSISDSLARKEQVMNEDSSMVQSTAAGLNVFSEKPNLNCLVSSREKCEEVLEVGQLSVERPVVCEDRENHVEVLISNNTDSPSHVRLSPEGGLHFKADAPDLQDGPESGSATKALQSSSTDAVQQCSGDVFQLSQPPSPTARVVMRSRRSPQYKAGQTIPCATSNIPSPGKVSQTGGDTSPQRHTLDGSINDYPFESFVRAFGDYYSRKGLLRTSSEPSLRVTSPVVPQLAVQQSPPRKEARSRHRRSNSASARARWNHRAMEGHAYNTQSAHRKGYFSLSPKESSRPLTYESSV